MRKAIFIFMAKSGKPVFADMSEMRFRKHLKQHEGKIYEIYLREIKRSLSQNNFYWANLENIEKETGNNANDLHEYFKRKFLPPKFIKVFGKEMKIPNTTTELSKVDFGEYLEKISAESGVPLLDPLEAGYIK